MAISGGRSERRARMTLAAHVAELRNRALRSGVAITLGTVGGWFLGPLVMAGLRSPIVEVAESQHRLAQLNYDNITGAFDLHIQVAITAGLVLSSPVWLYHIWAFFVPALTRRELRFGLGFFLGAVPLFLGGCVVGWFVIPHIVSMLVGFAGTGSASLIQANDYFTFVLKLVLAIGIAFVFPVFLILLNLAGLLSGRSIVRSWRLAVIAIVVFTGLVTPSADVLSMLVLAAPLVLLYLLSATIAILHDRKVSREIEEPITNTVGMPS